MPAEHGDVSRLNSPAELFIAGCAGEVVNTNQPAMGFAHYSESERSEITAISGKQGGTAKLTFVPGDEGLFI